MIPRTLGSRISRLAQSFPVVSLTGPWQSGKTTLVKALFPDYVYLNLENLDVRAAAEEDPRRFLRLHAEGGAIIDEAQKAPDLFSYLQTIVDESGRMGRYVLTGSQNFLLLERVSQSLAGRVAVCHLLPLGIVELDQAGCLPRDLDSMLFTGGYPALYDRRVAPTDYFPSYAQTYVERDVRSIVNVKDLSTFQRFLRLCAGRVGQLVNFSSMGNELGVSYQTVRSWLSVLETSFVIFLLAPHHRNFNKRVVKQPKIYFYDTGLLCSLLDIHSERQLATHYLRGAIFESLVIAEVMKRRFHAGQRANAYFWRDSAGHEVDLLLEDGAGLRAVEVKSGETLNDDMFRGLRYFCALAGEGERECCLVYGGEVSQERRDGRVLGWRDFPKHLVPS